MSQASLSSKSFAPSRSGPLPALLRELFAATPLAIFLKAVAAQ